MRELRPALPGEISAELAETARRADDYARESVASNTRRSYKSDWKDFLAYCARHGIDPLPAPPQVVALYITSLVGSVKPTTIERRLAAIGFYHRTNAHQNPASDNAVRQILSGIMRKHGSPAKAKAPATDDVLLKLLLAVEGVGKRTLRDRVVLLLGFAGGFRRSELVAVDVAHLQRDPKGYRVLIPGSKTDQQHKGRFKAIPRYHVDALDPVGAIDAWIERAGIVDGPLLRSFDIKGELTMRRLGAGEIARIVKRAASKAGLDPEVYAAHSLRSGMVTSAGRKNVPIPDIADVTHQSIQTVLGYWKAATAFENPPLLKIFGESPPKDT